MKSIYADYNASYPCSEEHLEELFKRLKSSWGNPSSIHSYGRDAKHAMEMARKNIANLLGSERKNIIFTSGATEANNMVIQGLLTSQKYLDKPHIVYTATEHPSVSQPIETLQQRGLCQATKVTVDEHGEVNEEALFAAIKDNTIAVALIHVNNETGSINDICRLSKKLKQIKADLHVHSDAVQSFGKSDLTWVDQSMLSSLSISGHKVGALKGIGCLWSKDASFKQALFFGGGQESSLRSGTENLPGIISLGLQCQKIQKNPSLLLPSKSVYQLLLDEVCSISGSKVHSNDNTLGNTVNFHIDKVEGEVLMLQLDMNGICVSSGSACSSGVSKPSPVLTAQGYSDWVASNSIRISLGAGSSTGDVKQIVSIIKQTVQQSPPV